MPSGKPLYQREGRFIKKKYFDQTEPSSTSTATRRWCIGRFVPIVRTFITVVAGVGRMERRRFFLWSGVGAVLWVFAVTLLGYFLGQAFPGLKDNLELAILAVVAVSVIPMVVEVLRHRSASRTAAEETVEAVDDLVDGRD